jgi:hypothetical protein
VCCLLSNRKKRRAFSEHHLTYTPISGLLIGASRSVLAYFFPSLTTSLFYISHFIQPLNLKLGSSLKHLRYISGKIVRDFYDSIYILFKTFY